MPRCTIAAGSSETASEPHAEESLIALVALLVAPDAHAASLDLIEVGGAWGTPAATNPSALWWNPAGLAAGGGTQFLVEGAPTFARVVAQRDNPDYGDPDPTFTGQGYPADYDYGGVDDISFDGVVPFLGVSSDLTIDGLGVGVGLMVPHARGGQSDQLEGANRFALREGNIQIIQATAAVGYQIADLVAIGASASFLHSTYSADLDTTTYPDLAHAVGEVLGTVPLSFQDAYIEDPNYATRTVFDVQDTSFTFGAGVYVTPLKSDKLGISLAYNHGARVDNSGPVDLTFGCPPDCDIISRFAAETQGLCNAQMSGDGSIGYDLPSRLHLGVVVRPIDRVRAELFGSYVMWSQFTDFDITTDIAADQVQVDDPEVAEETAALITQDRQWARDNRNTFFVGVDGKVKVHRFLGLGARVTYDRAAVPDELLSANNFDNDTLILSGLVFGVPISQLSVGLSFSHHLMMTRTTATSAYAVTIDDDAALADRYFYPSSAGTYSGSINRIGISLKGRFGPDTPKL